MEKRKHPLPFEKLIFRNGQQVRDADGKIYVAMTSTLERRTKKIEGFLKEHTCISEMAITRVG